MFHTRFCVTAGAVAGLFELTVGMGFSQSQPQPPAQAQPMPAVLRDYQPVTADRLGNPEDGNWLSIRRTYDGWGYSPLDQITADNVKGLRPDGRPQHHANQKTKPAHPNMLFHHSIV